MTRSTPIPTQRPSDAASPTIPLASTVSITHSGMHWTALADVSESLFGTEAPHWENLEQDPSATCVKTGYQRGIWRVNLHHAELFAKVFAGRGWIDWLKALWGLGNGQREWRIARHAIAKGVPVARPLAIGVKRSRPVSIVYACEAFVGGVTLPEAWAVQAKAEDSRGLQNRLIEAIASLYAAAHRAGLHQLDGHPNNVLVRSDDADGFSAQLIDLAWARIGKRPLDTRKSAASLAQLDHYFRRLSTRTQRLRFLHAYHAQRLAHDTEPSITDRLRRLLVTMEEEGARHAKRLGHRRDRRLHRNGKYFGKISLGYGWSGVFALKLTRRHIFDLSELEDRTAPSWKNLIAPMIEPRHDSADGGGDRDSASGVVLQTERPSGLAARLLWTVCGSPARRRFQDTHRRRHRDEDAPLILGYAEQRKFGLVVAGLIVRPG